MTRKPELAGALAEDFRAAEITPAEKAMLVYAEKLTIEPWNMKEQDVTNLRNVGFSDVAILDVNQIASYYAYVNRLADGLGVDLEDIWDDT